MGPSPVLTGDCRSSLPSSPQQKEALAFMRFIDSAAALEEVKGQGQEDNPCFSWALKIHYMKEICHGPGHIKQSS